MTTLVHTLTGSASHRHRAPWKALLLLASLVVAGHLGAADVLERDIWYVGLIGGKPSASMHMTVLRHEDGSRQTTAVTRIVLSRALGDQVTVISVDETQQLEEAADGMLTSFRIDQDQNGSITSALGRIEGAEVVATVARLGRSEIQRIPIPAGTALMGMQASQDLLVKGPAEIGQSVTSSGVILVGGQIAVMATAAELVERRADGDRLFLMKTPVMPPFRALIDPAGDLRKMEVNLGILSLILQRSETAPILEGAEISPTGLAKAAGPMPLPRPINHYRLGAAAAAIPQDDFQTLTAEVAEIRAQAEPSLLPDPAPYLAAEPQYELDDPELRAWVAEEQAKGDRGTADLAERLRLLVRTRLVEKDLGMADGSALEAFRSKRGDCTEHANLLTAALRIAGIPSRTEVGVVYAAPYGGWVGHAWNSAYLEGRWVHLDSAYPGIPRSLYLKLATTSGADAVSTAGALAQGIVALSGATIEFVQD